MHFQSGCKKNLILFNIFSGILYRLNHEQTSTSLLWSGGVFEVYRGGLWVPVCTDHYYYYGSSSSSVFDMARLICKTIDSSFNGIAHMSYGRYYEGFALSIDYSLYVSIITLRQFKDYLDSIPLRLQYCDHIYVTCLDVSGM